MSLTTLFGIPTIGFLLLLILPFNTQEQKVRGKQITLLFSILTFIESIRL